MANPWAKAQQNTAKGRRDAFERDHEVDYTFQRYKREFDIAKDSVEKGERSLNQYVNGEAPTFEELHDEVNRRFAITSDQQRIQKTYRGLLEKYKNTRHKDSEESIRKRNGYADTVAKVFPAVRDDVTRVQQIVDGELRERRAEVKDLQVRIARYEREAGKSEGVKSVEDVVQQILEAKEADSSVRDELERTKRRHEERKNAWEEFTDHCRKKLKRSEELISDLKDEKETLAAVITRLQHERDAALIRAENAEGEVEKLRQSLTQVDGSSTAVRKENTSLTNNIGQVEQADGAASMAARRPSIANTPSIASPTSVDVPTASGTPVVVGGPMTHLLPVQRNYSFLQSGLLASGPRTLNVSSSLLQRMDVEVVNYASKNANWPSKTLTSHKRCVYYRVNRVNAKKNPLASETPHEACKNCTNNWHLCVLIGDDGPVIVPLPASARGAGVLPSSVDYYIRARGAGALASGAE